MPSFDITFNAVAASLHFSAGDVAGLRISSMDGDLAFQPTTQSTGADIWPVAPRLRGGLEVRVDGPAAALLLQNTGLAEGQYLILGAIKDGWVTSKRHVPTPTQEKPSKIWPTARLWRLEGIAVESSDPQSLGLNFQQANETPEAGGWRFVATVDAEDIQAEARAKATALKFWQWCKANLVRDEWKLEVHQHATSRIDIGDAGIRTMAQRSTFDLSLTLKDENDAVTFKLGQKS